MFLKGWLLPLLSCFTHILDCVGDVLRFDGFNICNFELKFGLARQWQRGQKTQVLFCSPQIGGNHRCSS